MIGRVKLVNIPVADQDRAVRFYCDTLGFTKVAEFPNPDGPRWIELMAPEGGAKVVLHAPHDCDLQPGGFMNVVFTSRDVMEAYDQLRRSDVQFVQELREAEWGSSFVFKDSEGNSFAFTSDN